MLITPPSTVEDFQGLIQWLADEYHDGTVSAIAGRIGVSVATPAFWRRGLVLPTLDNVERLCQAYRLEFALVRELVFKSQLARRRRPVPFTSGASQAAPLPVGEPERLVDEVAADPHRSLTTRRDETLCKVWDYLTPNRWTWSKLTHNWCLAIRASAARDRVRDLPMAA